MPATYQPPQLRTPEAVECAGVRGRLAYVHDGFGRSERQSGRPEPESLYNGGIREGEHARVFPISNGTEFDVCHRNRRGYH